MEKSTGKIESSNEQFLYRSISSSPHIYLAPAKITTTTTTICRFHHTNNRFGIDAKNIQVLDKYFDLRFIVDILNSHHRHGARARVCVLEHKKETYACACVCQRSACQKALNYPLCRLHIHCVTGQPLKRLSRHTHTDVYPENGEKWLIITSPIQSRLFSFSNRTTLPSHQLTNIFNHRDCHMQMRREMCDCFACIHLNLVLFIPLAICSYAFWLWFVCVCVRFFLFCCVLSFRFHFLLRSLVAFPFRLIVWLGFWISGCEFYNDCWSLANNVA